MRIGIGNSCGKSEKTFANRKVASQSISFRSKRRRENSMTQSKTKGERISFTSLLIRTSCKIFEKRANRALYICRMHGTGRIDIVSRKIRVGKKKIRETEMLFFSERATLFEVAGRSEIFPFEISGFRRRAAKRARISLTSSISAYPGRGKFSGNEYTRIHCWSRIRGKPRCAIDDRRARRSRALPFPTNPLTCRPFFFRRHIGHDFSKRLTSSQCVIRFSSDTKPRETRVRILRSTGAIQGVS